MKIFVGICGASGQIYAGRLLRALQQSDTELSVCFSDGAVEVIRSEELRLPDTAGRDEIVAAFLGGHGVSPVDLDLLNPDEMSSAQASGSSLARAAIVCPCSMSTLGSMTAGITRNLIHRVADVMLKEARPLIVVPRETPLSQIHLRNLLRLSRAGAVIVPAMPAFYQHPETIEDLADFVVGKILDVLEISHDLFSRWEGA
jgi:4-hydroxy-3-polyprenylbenzoate decarboxylase